MFVCVRVCACVRGNEYVCVLERERQRKSHSQRVCVFVESELIVCLCVLLREKMCVRVLKVTPTGFTL